MKDASLAEKIAAQPLDMLPSPHFYLAEALPRSLYADLVENLPETRHYSELPGSGPPPRLIFDILGDDDLARLDEGGRKFWRGFTEDVMGEQFMRAVCARFANAVRDPFDYEKATVNRTLKLSRDRGTYQIGVHTDGPYRLISMLLYLAPDRTRPELGTSLYTPRDPSFTCAGGPHHDRGLFNLAKTMPYLPNAFFAFSMTDRSFHGLEPLPGAVATRDCLLITIRYDRKPGVSVPDYTA